MRAMSEEFRFRAEVLELLLSFACRRHVQIRFPGLYLQRDGDWVLHAEGGGWDFPGATEGVGWYYGEEELAAFLAHAYPRMVDQFDELRGGKQRTGLRLALRLLDTARGDLPLELQYLHTAMAFEVLVNASRYSVPIFPEDQFPTIKQAISAALRTLPEEVRPSDEQLKSIEKQFPNLNRLSLMDRAFDFLTATLKPYPKQEVTRSDLRCFIDIRNAITHSGSMRDAGKTCKASRELKEDYGLHLHTEYMRLKSLLERVVLAMLEYNCRLLDFPWQHWEDA